MWGENIVKKLHDCYLSPGNRNIINLLPNWRLWRRGSLSNLHATPLFFFLSGKQLLINQLMTRSGFAALFFGVTLSSLDLFDDSDWSMLIIVETGFDFLCVYMLPRLLCKQYQSLTKVSMLSTPRSDLNWQTEQKN